jgi:RecB family exonuclease
VAGRGFVTSLGEAVNEMLLEDVGPEMIRGHDLLYRMYGGYLSYLEANGLADNSQLPSLALRALGGSIPKTMTDTALCWIGFMSFTGAQLKLIKELAALGLDMEFFVPDSGGVNFRDAAAQLGTPATSVETEECLTRRVVSPDMYSQCEFIADMLTRQDGEADCGILASHGMTRAIGTALSRRGIPWQPRSEVTVDRTALMDIARAAWETHKLGWPPARTANLLRSPAIGIEPDPIAFAAKMPEGLAAWKEFFAGDTAALDAISRLESFCELVGREDGSTSEELLRGLYQLSGDGEWESRLAIESLGDPDMDPAIREIASARMEIAFKLNMMEDVTPALGEASSVRFAGDGAMEFLTTWAKEAATALPPRYKEVVSVYEAPPPVLASHGVWIMTDADASRYPGTSSDHALLSENIREAVNASPFDFAHLPTIHEKRSQKEAMFRRLLAMGEQFTVAARSAYDASGNPSVESPFLRGEGLEKSRWKIGAETEGTAQHETNARIFRKFPIVAVSPPPEGEKTRVSLSHLDRALDCPFAYWCDRTARFAPPPETGEILDRLTLGNVMHETWRRVTEAASERETTHGAALFSEWDAAISSMSGKYPLLSDARAAAALSDLRGRMSSVAGVIDEMWARADESGMKRLWTKTEFTLPSMETENAVFHGRADRIDFWAWARGEGAVIFDYKLGKTKNYNRSYQLAAYGAALEVSGIPVIGLCYLCHGDAGKTGAWSPDVKDAFARGTRGAPCGDRIGAVPELLAGVDRLISSGRYEANYDSPSCRTCGYTAICRRGERRGDFEASEDGGDADD